MRVGVPREVKADEYRVALTPAGAHELVRAGHQVLVERDAGTGSSIADGEYAAAGADVVGSADAVWDAADLVVKVKEPVPEEYGRLRAGQVLFAYLHLAASRSCTEALVASGATAVAFETVQRPDGTLPLLTPMSEVAGRMAPQVGAHVLERESGGRGVLLGGVSGARDAEVVVLGAGVAGTSAASVAVGMGAATCVLDRDVDKLRRLDRMFQGRVQTLASTTFEVERVVLDADLVVGAVLVPGARAPELVGDDLVRRMKAGAVLVDVAIDQGGCFAHSRPTTHSHPTFAVHDVLYYCVANMPGAVPHTSTHALANVTLPSVLEIARSGLAAAVAVDPALARGVNVVDGSVVYPAVAEAHGLPCVPLAEVLGGGASTSEGGTGDLR
ncbi:MAG: alanine dehydrogenase [Actinomycetota bacterium]|jgi:alanine dehydrogenase|nr:alanine dehydrogenase [Actinomycetota bacterium]